MNQKVVSCSLDLYYVHILKYVDETLSVNSESSELCYSRLQNTFNFYIIRQYSGAGALANA